MRFLSTLSIASSLTGVIGTSSPHTVQDLEFPIQYTRGGIPRIQGRFRDSEQIHRFHLFSREYSDGLLGEEPELFLITDDSPFGIPIIDRTIRSVGIGFESVFSRMIGSMMLIPSVDRVAGNEGAAMRMIAGPTDPLAYCTDRQMMMVDVVNSFSGHPSFQAEISLLSADTQEYMSLSSMSYFNEGPGATQAPFEISTEITGMRVPRQVRAVILEEISMQGIASEFGTHMIYLEPGCADIIPRLPTIQLRSPSGMIRLMPEDYVRVNETTGRCTLPIEYDDNDFYREFTLGLSFIEQFGIFFDYNNYQIGICDPL